MMSLQMMKFVKKMFDEWNDFHSQIAYQDFSHFWDKELFVNDIENVELSQELFIKLICDRVFLFLNYSRSLANPAYPNLMVGWGRELPDESPEDTPVTRQLRENTLFIREHGFMPTNTLRDRWRGWQHNIRRINAALERRTKFVRQGAHLPRTPAVNYIVTRKMPCQQQIFHIQKMNKNWPSCSTTI